MPKIPYAALICTCGAPTLFVLKKVPRKVDGGSLYVAPSNDPACIECKGILKQDPSRDYDWELGEPCDDKEFLLDGARIVGWRFKKAKVNPNERR